MAQAALGVEIAIKMDFFDPAFGAGFFQRFSRRRFAQRKAVIDVAFGKSPFAGAGIDQQKFKKSPTQAVANGSNLHRLLEPGWLAGRIYSRANRWLPRRPKKWQKSTAPLLLHTP